MISSSFPQECSSTGLPWRCGDLADTLLGREDVLAQRLRGGEGAVLEAHVVVQPLHPDAVHRGRDLHYLAEDLVDALDDGGDQVGLVEQGVAELLEAHDEGEILEGAAGEHGADLHPVREMAPKRLQAAEGGRVTTGQG